MKKIAVVLSGCGVFDGSEIYETVVTLLALDKQGAEALCVAPNIPQHHVINHVTNEPIDGESRRVLLESARLARGKITPIEDVDINSLDGAIFPGGFGAAKNSCNFATNGSDYDVDPSVSLFIKNLHAAGKPMGFLCIAPVVAAGVLGAKGIKLTIGNDPSTAQALESKGAVHIECSVDEIVADEEFKIVSTPAFMLAKRIGQLESGINKVVETVLDW